MWQYKQAKIDKHVPFPAFSNVRIGCLSLSYMMYWSDKTRHLKMLNMLSTKQLITSCSLELILKGCTYKSIVRV